MRLPAPLFRQCQVPIPGHDADGRAALPLALPIPVAFAIGGQIVRDDRAHIRQQFARDQREQLLVQSFAFVVVALLPTLLAGAYRAPQHTAAVAARLVGGKAERELPGHRLDFVVQGLGQRNLGQRIGHMEQLANVTDRARYA